MLVQAKPRTYSPEEYLVLEEKSQTKHEYQDGEIIPMTGGTTNHNKIAGNFYAYFKFATKGKPYEVFMADVRLWIPANRRYTYPDVQIICGDIAYHENRKDTVTNPSAIVEVLSKSTRDYDKGDKFKFYRSIPEFREYITIAQYGFEVEQYVKTDEGKWLITYLESQESVLSLATVEFEIPLTDLYEGVRFEDNEREIVDS